MTFISQVVSVVDPDNSVDTTATTFLGEVVSTSGYNSIQVQISTASGSASRGFIIYFSSDSAGSVVTNDLSSTVSNSAVFIKSFPVLDSYYQISFTGLSSADLNIVSRLCTTVEVPETDSVSAFNNQMQSAVDAFGKARVSTPLTILDLKVPPNTLASGTAPTTEYLLNEEQLVGKYTGTSSISNDNGMLKLQCTAPGTYISQSRKYATYQPGKSILILCSGIIQPYSASSIATGAKGRIGYFDDNNGIFYECDSSGECSIVLRKDAIAITIVTQADWNIDSMNGTGTSGLELDFTRAQLFVMDAEWLGVGRIRFGFYVFGRIYYCHEITNINVLLGPYTSTFNLPVRYELDADVASVGETFTLHQICSTVLSEGGFVPVGRSFNANTLRTSSSLTEVPILALRGNTSTNYYHQSILPTQVQFISTAKDAIFQYFIYLYQATTTTTGPVNVLSTGVDTWTSPPSNYSIAEYGTFSTDAVLTTSGRILVSSGYSTSRTSTTLQNLTDIITSYTQITSNVNNASDVIVIAFKELVFSGPVTSNCNIYCTLDWQEVY